MATAVANANVTATVSTEDMWKKWMGALQAIVFPGGLADGQQFSAASITLNIDLANADPDITNYNIYHLGDVVPAGSPAYAPSSGLLSSYATFLDWIDLGGSINPNLASQINLAAAALTAAQTNFNQVQAAAYAQYLLFKQISGDSTVSFNAWAAQQYPTYQQALVALQGADSQYNSLMIEAYGPGFSVVQAARAKVGPLTGAQSITSQNAYNMKVKVGSIAPPGSGPVVLPGSTPPDPKSNLVSTYAPSYTLEAFTTKYAEWQAASVARKNNAGGSITITQASKTYNYDQFGWSASVNGSWLGDFLEVFGAGSSSGQRTSINTTSQNFSIQIDFVGLASFPISPGLWWDNCSLVSTYHNLLKKDAPVFFGDHGSLARVACEAVIGFEPTVKLTMDANDYNNVKSSWQAQANLSIGIGPFRIGSAEVSTYGSKQDMRWDDASATVTIGPVQSTLPILLGVVSQRLGD
jgi:hypothetical protein